VNEPNTSNAKWTEWLAELLQKNRRLAECVVAYWLGRGKLGEPDVDAILGLSAMPDHDLLRLGVDTRKSVKADEKRERELAISIGLGDTDDDVAVDNVGPSDPEAFGEFLEANDWTQDKLVIVVPNKTPRHPAFFNGTDGLVRVKTREDEQDDHRRVRLEVSFS